MCNVESSHHFAEKPLKEHQDIILSDTCADSRDGLFGLLAVMAAAAGDWLANALQDNTVKTKL